MQTLTLRPGQLDSYTNVLDPEIFQEFFVDCGERYLRYEQRYPRRLFTHRDHESWLRDYFNTFIAHVQPGSSLQQIFVGLELPGSEFWLHHNHPNLSAVICYSLDTAQTPMLRVLDHNTEQNYFPARSAEQQQLEYQDYEFQRNQAFVMRGSDLVWGFNTHVQPGAIKRSVWIYLGT